MKTLIAYFSYSNNTKRLVEGIVQRFPFDVVRIERKVPYSKDYDTCAYQEAKEEYEKNLHPLIQDLPLDYSAYDRILLFFPIWWYTIPMPIATFCEKNLKDYRGEVVLFANSYTNDPQYMVNSKRDLEKVNPNLHFVNGLFNRSLDQHLDFLKKEEK